MSSDKVPGSQPASLSADISTRRRGRMGLAVPWENIPWWGLIILIVGVIVGYSVLTSTQYLDAIYFLFDLPWNKQALGQKAEASDSGQWSVTVAPALEPGTYSLYAEYQNEAGETVGRSDVYRIEIPKGAVAAETAAIATPSETPTRVDSTTPTIAGTAPAGATVILWDDFSHQPLRVLGRIWGANGVMLTIRVTIIAFAGALVMGLLFGLMRVSSRAPDLTVNAGWRLLAGLGLIVLIWLAIPSWRNVGALLPVAIVIEAIMFLLPAMPYTLSTLYVEVVRGVPMLVIILYMGFAITPALRNASQNSFLGEVDLRGLPAAVIGLSFGYGAYLAEVYRAGIESIPKGQMEAARSLGMSYFQAMRHVILPQAIRVVLPPLGNDFIAMLKDTSLISVIALPEVLQQGRLWISRNFRAFEGFNSVALLYLVMTLLLSLLVRFIERKSALPGR
jgi:ABC-type amino acid transport system permease subunit